MANDRTCVHYEECGYDFCLNTEGLNCLDYEKKSKPILFNTNMVKAILDGQKTQTRRIVSDKEVSFNTGEYLKKPPYAVGDTLWVRETWCNINKPGIQSEYYYYADTIQQEDFDPKEWKWKPSIHMPRAAARIFLKVTNVRVERLQDITAEGAIREGISVNPFENEINTFQNLWNSIYSNWHENPWVWVIEFERMV